MNKIIIFGAGKKGRELLRKLAAINKVIYFADNDENKIGTYIENLLVISFNYMVSLYQKGGIDIILSSNFDEMRSQLINNGIQYWDNESYKNSYFCIPDVMNRIDRRLLEKYFYDDELKQCAALCGCNNWYREEFCSNENEQLVTLMKEKKTDELSTFLDHIYSENIFYNDEYYKNRPGMRLINNILMYKNMLQNTINICELACGHGELLKKLKENGCIVHGVDQNNERVQFCRKNKIDCIQARVESVPYEDSVFDVVICQECLEHVINPNIVVKEMRRILKHKNGMVFCTVPYGKFCDDPSHVRQFYVDKFYSLFEKNGFKVINIVRIPYLNYSNEDNLFLAARIDD